MTAQTLKLSLKQRLRRFRDFLGIPTDLLTWETLITFCVTTAMMVIMAASILRASWVQPGFEALVLIAVLGMFSGIALAFSLFTELTALLISFTYAFVLAIFWQAFALPEGTIQVRLITVLSGMFDWVDGIIAGERVTNDDMMLAIFLAVMFWYLAHNAAWHLFRVGKFWRGVAPPAIVLLITSFQQEGEGAVSAFLAGYAFLTLTLFAHLNAQWQQYAWYRRGMRAKRDARSGFLRAGMLATAVVLLVAWTLPTLDQNPDFQKLQQDFARGPLKDINRLFERLTSRVEGVGQQAELNYYGGDTLNLGGPIQLGEHTVMWVQAPDDVDYYYWRSRIYSYYDGYRWTAYPEIRYTDQGPAAIIDQGAYFGRQIVQQTFTMAIDNLSSVHTAPQPYQINLRVDLDVTFVGDQQFDIIVIRPSEPLRAGDRYTVTSLIAQINANNLRAASTDYPDWVKETYLQLPYTVTDRTRDLALQIANDARAFTPYDRARAIETWLRYNIIYNERAAAPPPDRDFVDWVLFDALEGYCNYYASSMVIMLRALGIPARMAAGFAEGEWDTERGAYNVRESDAHTWVEVYFPNFGWIEFEPTAGRTPIERAIETPEPFTATPTTTLTPEPQEIAGASPTPEPPLPADQQATTTPHATMTPFPSPTPIPDMNNPTGGVLRGLLIAFAVLVLGAFAVLAIVGLILWQLEYRGMRGLSPISRAYARLLNYGRWIGLPIRAQDTPNERVRVIGRVVPRGVPYVRRLTQLYNSERYDKPSKPLAQSEGIRAEIARLWAGMRRVLMRYKFDIRRRLKR